MKRKGLKQKVLIIFSAIILLSLFSCKSHKKAQKEEVVIIEEVIKVKPPVSNKKTIGEKIAEEAITWVGTPYGFGKSEKGVATDCSGMVITVFEQIAEIKLPRNSAEQADFCEDIKEEEKILAGDLVFFATGKDRNKVSHVGIMIDNSKFVHASGSKGVIISEMTTPYYRRNFLKYGRVLIQQ